MFSCVRKENPPKQVHIWKKAESALKKSVAYSRYLIQEYSLIRDFRRKVNLNMSRKISQFGKGKKKKVKTKSFVEDLLTGFFSLQTIRHYHILYKKLKQQKHSERELREKESFLKLHKKIK